MFITKRLILLVFLIVGSIGALLSILWMVLSILFSPNGKRAWDIAISLDRLTNAATGGDGKETISSRGGRLEGTTKWACYLCKFLNYLQKDHCKNSIGF